MKTGNVFRIGLAILALAGAVLTGAPNAQAQPPGGMPPGMMAKIKAWQKWGEQHQKLTLLSDQLFQLEKMNEDPKFALNKTQAGRMLTVLKPWRSRSSMTEDQATTLNKQIGNVLTVKQIKKMTQIEPPSVTMKKRGFGGGGRPGGGAGGPGGKAPGGPGGGMPAFPDPPKGGWNPLNPDTMPFVQARPAMKKRSAEFFASLEHQAKG